MLHSYQLVMVLLVVSLGDRFSVSGKVGQGEVGGFILGVKAACPCLGLAVERLWLALG